eukprot:gene2831-3430_t
MPYPCHDRAAKIPAWAFHALFCVLGVFIIVGSLPVRPAGPAGLSGMAYRPPPMLVTPAIRSTSHLSCLGGAIVIAEFMLPSSVELQLGFFGSFLGEGLFDGFQRVLGVITLCVSLSHEHLPTWPSQLASVYFYLVCVSHPLFSLMPGMRTTISPPLPTMAPELAAGAVGVIKQVAWDSWY